MATQQIEDVSNPADRIKLAGAIALIVLGVVGFYLLSGQALIFRVLSVFLGIGAGIALAWQTNTGRRVLVFGRESWAETRKVEWPTKKETWTITLYVFLFVLVMAVFLWVVDKSLEWVLYDLVLGR